MKKKTICVGMISLFLLSSLGTATTLNKNNIETDVSSSSSVMIIPGEILVMFEENIEPSGSFSSFLVNEYDAISVETNEISNLAKVKVRQGTEQTFIENIKNDARVKYVTSNFAFSCSVTPDDPKFNEQWGLWKIKCPKAWDITTGDKDTKIAIIDTGVDYYHEDLDANCKHVGYDFVDINTSWYESEGFRLVEGEDYTRMDYSPMDNCGHGTHCAGIAGAVGDNDIGVSGVNWHCNIIPLRAGFSIITPQGTTTALMDLLACLNAIYNAAHPDIFDADVISMSWGFSGDDIAQDAIDLLEEYIDDAWSDGAVLVAGAGNENEQQCYYPARFDNVIGVGAIDEEGNRCDFSNYGDGLSLVAPGEDILSTVPDDEYESYSGTSCACPFVAGVAALAMARFPNYSNQEIRDLLENSADETGGGISTYYGNGLVDATLIEDDSPPNVAITKPQNALYIRNDRSCSFPYPIIFGPIHVQADASDSESGIDKVEFYLGNKLKYTDDEAPYSWYWNEPGIGMILTLKVKAYNNDGGIGQCQKTIYLYINPPGSFDNEYINDDSILTCKNFQDNKYKREFTATIPNSEDIDINDLETQGISILFTYEFDFGDGTTETIEDIKDLSYSVEHTYAKIGTYEVSTKITADIEVDMDCEYDGHYTTGFTSQKTVEITNGKSAESLFFNLLQRQKHTNIFFLLQKIFSFISS